MKIPVVAAMLAALAFAAPAAAQKAVPITGEPHHHLVYTSEQLRVFRVEVPAQSETLLHEHPVDYFWIAVGAADLVNAVAGKAEARSSVADGSIHFTPGGFAHVARVEGDRPFRNVTLEVTQAQSNPRNLCEAVLADKKTNCQAAMKRATAEFTGAEMRPAFETDQLRVTLLTIPPNATLSIAKMSDPPILVAVDAADGTVQMTCHGPAGAQVTALHSHAGDTYPDVGRRECSLHNSAAAVRFLAVQFAAAAR
jgi:hypothetical protein